MKYFRVRHVCLGRNWWNVHCYRFQADPMNNWFIFKKLFNKGIFLPIVYCLKWNRGSKRNIELLHFSGNCNNGRGMSLQSTTDHRSVLQVPKWTKKFFKKFFFFIAQLRGARTEDTCHLCKILQWDCTFDCSFVFWPKCDTEDHVWSINKRLVT